jgi:hypothetical protein
MTSRERKYHKYGGNKFVKDSPFISPIDGKKYNCRIRINIKTGDGFMLVPRESMEYPENTTIRLAHPSMLHSHPVPNYPSGTPHPQTEPQFYDEMAEFTPEMYRRLKERMRPTITKF